MDFQETRFVPAQGQAAVVIVDVETWIEIPGIETCRGICGGGRSYLLMTAIDIRARQRHSCRRQVTFRRISYDAVDLVNASQSRHAKEVQARLTCEASRLGTQLCLGRASHGSDGKLSAYGFSDEDVHPRKRPLSWTPHDRDTVDTVIELLA